jgi:hypothetical protein
MGAGLSLIAPDASIGGSEKKFRTNVRPISHVSVVSVFFAAEICGKIFFSPALAA